MRSLAAMLVIVVTALAGACGGRVADSSEPSPSTDGGTAADTLADSPATPPGEAGWRSFNMSLGEASLTWTTAERAEVGSILAGRDARLDVQSVPNAITRLVVANPRGAVGRAAPRPDGSFEVPIAAEALVGRYWVEEGVSSFTLNDPMNPLAGGVLRGTLLASAYGTKYPVPQAAVVIPVTITDDDRAPSWRLFATSQLTPEPLPWEHYYLWNEPIENTFDPSSAFEAPSPFSVHRADACGWEDGPYSTCVPKMFGFMLRLDDWSRAGTLSASLPAVRDLAGNTAAATSVSIPSVRVERRATNSYSPADGRGAPRLFGAAEELRNACDGTACLHLGPTEWKPCMTGMTAGAALWLPGRPARGIVSYRVRQTALDETALRSPLAPNALQVAVFGDKQPANTTRGVTGHGPPELGSVAAGTWDTGWIETRPIFDEVVGSTNFGVVLAVGGVGAKAIDYCAISTPRGRYRVEAWVRGID